LFCKIHVHNLFEELVARFLFWRKTISDFIRVNPCPSVVKIL
jgi:hypothetical protein